MKKYILFLILISIFSCNENKPVITSDGVNVDSLLLINSVNTHVVSESSKKSDTMITTKVDKTVQKIGNLETQINELKQENNELKGKLDDANDVGKPFRILPVSNN